MTSIVKIMEEEHSKIDELLLSIYTADERSAEYIFDEFFWVLKEHIFMEENLISKVGDKISDDYNIKTILGQHKEILEILGVINEKNIFNSGNELDDLSNLLKSHHKLEEVFLYEEFNNIMSEKEKLRIISRKKDFLKDLF